MATFVLAVGGWLLSTHGMGAEGSSLPGPCNGRSDPNVLLNAHAQEPKFILNVATDNLGVPYGVLIVNQGATRVYVDLFCRLWKHLPGQPTGGECEGESSHVAGGTATESDGATMVHVVGMGVLGDGTAVVVRVDARQTEEGKFFRVRYKPMGSHGGGEHKSAPSAAEGDEGCEDDGWTRVPTEGWAPLKLLNLRMVDA